MNNRNTSNWDCPVDRGSSFVSVRDFLREDTFQRDTDDKTRDICTYCVSIEDLKNDAGYFCPDCGPLGRFLCHNCLKYHKQFREGHKSVKSFAAATYNNRYCLTSDGGKNERFQEENDVAISAEELPRPDATVEEMLPVTSNRPNSKTGKDKLIHNLRAELKKTENEVEQLRKKLTQELEEVQESMTPRDCVGMENELENDMQHELVTPYNHQEQMRKKRPSADVQSDDSSVGRTKQNVTSTSPIDSTSQDELFNRALVNDKILEDIAEKYRNLYENQWEDAFDMAHEHFATLNKEGRVKLLIWILQSVNLMCKKERVKQDKELMKALYRTEKPRQDIPAGVKEVLKNLKFSVASEGIDSLTEEFINSFDESTEIGVFLHEVEEYVHECFAVCWPMALQSSEPYLFSNVRRLQALDRYLFKPFIANGGKVDYIVWPALVINTNHGRQVLTKGVVKCLKMKARFESKTARARSAVKHEDCREISKSARTISTKNSASMPEIPLLVKNLTLHKPKTHQTKRHHLALDKATPRRTADRIYDYQRDSDQYLRDLLQHAFGANPIDNARGQWKLDNGSNSNNCTANLNNVRQTENGAKQKCYLPYIRTVTNQHYSKPRGDTKNPR